MKIATIKLYDILFKAKADNTENFVRCMNDNGCKELSTITLQETRFLCEQTMRDNPSWFMIRFDPEVRPYKEEFCFFIPYDFAEKVLILGGLPV